MNKTQEREIAAFVESLELHLARLIEEVAPLLQGLARRQHQQAVEMSIADTWNGRTFFDPVKATLAQFFGSFVRENVKQVRRGDVNPAYTEEEQTVLRMVRGRQESKISDGSEKVQYTGPKEPSPKMDPPRKVGKECPPCFRCRYFYGWLPIGEFVPEKHSDPEIAEACERIDRRKIAIAQKVRSGIGWNESELQQD